MSNAGRPTAYHPALCEQAHNYCLPGATNDELAELFGVSPRTIDSWIARSSEFDEALPLAVYRRNWEEERRIEQKLPRLKRHVL